MRKWTLFGLVVAATLGAASTPALADGGAPVTFTEVAHGVTDVFVSDPACGDSGPGVVTFTFTTVLHVTQFADGRFNANGNDTGTFTFDPDDPALLEGTGRLESHFSASANSATSIMTNTSSVFGETADGTRARFNVTTHYTLVGEHGEHFVVSFDKVNCS